MKRGKASGAIAKIKASELEAHPPSLNLWQKALGRFWHDRAAMLAGVVVCVFALLAWAAPWISDSILQVDPNEQDLRNNYADPLTEGHLLGTDELGRDHLSRLLYGGQISLSIAFAAAILSLGIGITIGVFAGYYGGILDDLIMWFVTTLSSMPGLYLLILITALLDTSPLTLVLIFGFLGWTGTTRLVRAEAYSIKEREYVIAAQAVGASNLRIMFVHIVPNIFSLLIITLAQGMGSLILAESSLSFLGFGIQPPTPTWGNMLTGGLDYMRRAPHLVVLPGLLITLTVFCFYLIGDGLRDAFDPRIAD